MAAAVCSALFRTEEGRQALRGTLSRSARCDKEMSGAALSKLNSHMATAPVQARTLSVRGKRVDINYLERGGFMLHRHPRQVAAAERANMRS